MAVPDTAWHINSGVVMIRQYAVFCAISLVLVLLPASGYGQDAAQTTLIGGQHEVSVLADIPYREDSEADAKKHKLDLFLPKGGIGFPVLFFIHGGGWTSGDRKLYTMVGNTFARNGVATVVISYRLSPGVQHPGHITDVAKAYAWTVKNIARHGGRPDRIFVSGQSAGGHLAALLATNATFLAVENLGLKDIRGAMPISGIYTFRSGWMDRVIGKGKAAATSASPLSHVNGVEPPFLILYAASDFGGCERMSKDLNQALEKKNIETSCVCIPDRNHISIMYRLMLSEADPTTQAMLGFISRHSELKLRPRPESDTNPDKKKPTPEKNPGAAPAGPKP